jgi:hypothetical protein
MKRQYPRWTHGYIDQHGKPRFYLRRPGHKKIALPGLPWSPEFMEARDAALKGEGKIDIGANRTVGGSVNAALVSYYRSSAFTKALAESTQKTRPAVLQRFREDHGEQRIALMHRAAIAEQTALTGIAFRAVVLLIAPARAAAGPIRGTRPAAVAVISLPFEGRFMGSPFDSTQPRGAVGSARHINSVVWSPL